LYIRNDIDKRLRDHLCVMDAKSLYDALLKEARGREPRVALSVAEIKQGMATLGIRPRWIPHNEMLCDPLKKSFAKSNLRALLRTMRTGRLQLGCEKDEMSYRQAVKASGKAVPRLKGRGRHDDELPQEEDRD